VRLPLRIESPEKFISLFKSNPSITTILKDQNDETKERFYKNLHQAIREICPEDPISLYSTATLGIGTK
jgi:hypothetical protein